MIYSLPKTPLSTNPQDWRGKSIAIIRGFGYAGLIHLLNEQEKQNYITVNRANNHYSAFLILKSGRCDYVIDYKNPSDTILKTMSINGIKQILLSKIDIHVLINVNFPEADSILKRIETTYQQLDGNG